MILYFSGTGNSRYTARMIGQITGDQVFSMNKFMKTGESGMIASDKPFVFVTPIYAWRIPKIVEDFIRKTDFAGSSEAYFVVTCGGEAGNAEKYVKKLCLEKGLDFRGFDAVVMPENYIAMFSVPDQTEADKVIDRAKPHIKEISEFIKNGKPLTEKSAGVGGKFLSRVINPLFYTFQVNAKGFHVNNNCTSCGKCTGLCPMNNIQMVEGTPRWGKACTHCMACICGCPDKAVEYKKKTETRNRYYNNRKPEDEIES